MDRCQRGNPRPGETTKPVPAQSNRVNKFYLSRAEALIDVFAAANKYAAEHHSGAITKDDVRTIVLSVFIQTTPKPGQQRSY
jgi:hypothetical protein